MFKAHGKGAFRRFDNLHDARDNVMQDGKEEEGGADGAAEDPALTKRHRTAVLLDGNVLMMSVPESVGEINAFANIIYNYVRAALRTGSLVVVAFDEPAFLTQAKKEEQQRRDVQRKARTVECSHDMQLVPLGHEFTRQELDSLPDVHVLKADRKCRVRLYDDVIRRVFERVITVMQQWSANGHEPGCLILDGVEIRGADRALDEARRVEMVGTNPEILGHFKRATSIGEGDIKLMALENRLRELVSVNPDYAHFRLCVTSTTDTDSFMTFLIDVAKRRVNPYTGSLHSLFCMRELPSKRERETSANARATFLCCDVAMLEAHIQTHLWSMVTKKPSTDEMLAAVLALCASAALCGCDFTLDGLKGSRFDHFWESLPSFVATEPGALASFNSALDQQQTVAQSACQALYRVCVQASRHMQEKPRYKKQAQSVSDVPDTMLKRAVWSTAYWGLQEFPATTDWGFKPQW